MITPAAASTATPRDAAIRHSFSRAASTYDAHAGLQRDVVLQAVALLRPHLRDSMRVLDAGCGTGMLARHLAHPHLLQVDSAAGMAQQAARATGLPALCADIRALPLAAGSVDAYVSSLCLQWIENPEAAFSEARRVLTPGGRALFTTFGPDTLHALRDAFRQSGLDDHVLTFSPAATLTDALARSGLHNTHCSQASHLLHFASPRALLQHLKGLGATYRASGGGLRGLHYLHRLEQALAQAWGEHIPAQFEVIYLMAEKPA